MITDTDKGFEDIQAELNEFKGMKIFVGVQGSAAASDAGGISLGEVATLLEMGTSKMPARPFLRTTVDRERSAIGKLFERELKGIKSPSRRTAIQAANRVGIGAVALVQKTIRASTGWAAPLAAATSRAKGSSKPLIDTGRLMQSITYKIERNGVKIGGS